MVIIGIDVGGSTTKIVGYDTATGSLIVPQLIRANDPVTATYGAFGKFTDENGIAISDIEKIMVTGVGSAYIKDSIYGIPCTVVPEFDCIGKGARYISALDNVLAVSMGTGTALVHASEAGSVYLGGTGVGGGTLMGLSRLLLHAESVEHIDEYINAGELDKIDLRICDVTGEGTLTALSRELTASNFGNVSDNADRDDIARGIANLVFETVGVSAIFASRGLGTTDIVLTGNLTRLRFCAEKFDQFNHLGYGVTFHIPECAEFATVIGAALLGV